MDSMSVPVGMNRLIAQAFLKALVLGIMKNGVSMDYESCRIEKNWITQWRC